VCGCGGGGGGVCGRGVVGVRTWMGGGWDYVKQKSTTGRRTMLEYLFA